MLENLVSFEVTSTIEKMCTTKERDYHRLNVIVSIYVGVFDTSLIDRSYYALSFLKCCGQILKLDVF